MHDVPTHSSEREPARFDERDAETDVRALRFHAYVGHVNVQE